jgi:hypothetical protein
MPRICRADFPVCRCAGFSNPVFPRRKQQQPGISSRHSPRPRSQTETGDWKVAHTGRLENLPYPAARTLVACGLSS